MFLLPSVASFFNARFTRQGKRIGWTTVWMLLTLLIGYRFEVGGDWFSYLAHMELNNFLSFGQAVKHFDPAHGAVNWWSNHLGWGVYGVNLIYGGIFAFGLIAFCRSQPRSLLALAIAMPYLVVVVAMGYSRQGVAIGIAMLALLALAERRTVRFVVYVAIAALFHKTAVVLIPIAALASTRHKVWTAVWVSVTAVLMYLFYLQEAAESLVENYLEAEYASQGGAIRIAMNTVPALCFLLFRRQFHLDRSERALWTWVALIALAFIPAFYYSPSSTAVDRVALYFIPIQVYVLSRLPDVLWHGRYGTEVQAGVLVYYGLVLFVWLNFAGHAFAWLPYQFYPLVD